MRLLEQQGLRLYRSNLISAQTCVGKPPVSHLPSPPPLSGAGQNLELLTFSSFSPSNNSDTNRCAELLQDMHRSK